MFFCFRFLLFSFFSFFLDCFLGRKRVFLFSYFLGFFYEFPTQENGGKSESVSLVAAPLIPFIAKAGKTYIYIHMYMYLHTLSESTARIHNSMNSNGIHKVSPAFFACQTDSSSRDIYRVFIKNCFFFSIHCNPSPACNRLVRVCTVTLIGWPFSVSKHNI